MGGGTAEGGEEFAGEGAEDGEGGSGVAWVRPKMVVRSLPLSRSPREPSVKMR